MSDIFEFNEKTILPANKFAIPATGSKRHEMWHENKKIWHRTFF